MRIVRVEAIPIALPFRERYRTASGELDRREMAIVRLHTDNGPLGLGEAVPLSLRGGPDLATVLAEIAACEPVIAGAGVSAPLARVPVEIRVWINDLLGACRRRGAGAQALTAIDIALHDLAGRVSGLPLWRLLGAGDLIPVCCNATLDAGEPEAVGKRAQAQLGEGFRTFKVKVGVDADADVARVAAVRAAVGERADVRLDANGAWTPAEAVDQLARLASCELELVEQPCADAKGLAQVRAKVEMPVVADESVASLADAQRVAELGACDAATVKLSKVGGLLETLRIAAVVPTYLSSALDGPIGIAAAAHLVQALPREGYATRFDHGLATLDLFVSSYASHEGLTGAALFPASTPGLGVEIDETRLDSFRL
jgi:L-alanine-DL-glutamate epimerase-like enolase superfamily enzyme